MSQQVRILFIATNNNKVDFISDKSLDLKSSGYFHIFLDLVGLCLTFFPQKSVKLQFQVHVGSMCRKTLIIYQWSISLKLVEFVWW